MAVKKFLDINGFKHFIEKVIGKTDISEIGDGTVKGAIEDINSNLAPKSITLTKNPSYDIVIANQNCFYTKALKRVRLMAKFSYSNGIGLLGVWGYVPVGYRPTSNLHFVCHAFDGNNWVTGVGSINTSGQITQSVVSIATIIIFECEYII